MGELERHYVTPGLTLGATLIELLAAVVIVYHVGRAVVLMVCGRGVDEARLAVAEGVLAGLSFSIAGTLLKTIALQDWRAIRLFAFVLVLRTLLKKVFQREQRMVRTRRQRDFRASIAMHVKCGAREGCRAVE